MSSRCKSTFVPDERTVSAVQALVDVHDLIEPAADHKNVQRWIQRLPLDIGFRWLKPSEYPELEFHYHSA